MPFKNKKQHRKYQKEQIKKYQKFLLRLLHIHIGNYYPLRKYLGIDYKGKIDNISHLSIGYNTKIVDGKLQQTRTYQSSDLGYKLNLILDKIPQLVLLPAFLQPTYGLGALILFALIQTTYQPSTKDNDLYSGAPTTNYGSTEYANLSDNIDGKQRIVIEFNISDIPANATFSQGDLLLYYYDWTVNDPSGKIAWAYKLTRTDWVEAESTWNIYKTGSNWTAAGGDYVTTSPSGDDATIPASYAWVTWNINAIVQDAYDNTNNVEILVKYAVENAEVGSVVIAWFYSKEYTTNIALRPKLTVTYTTTNLKSVNSIAKANIKSINSIAIADVKSVNTIT